MNTGFLFIHHKQAAPQHISEGDADNHSLVYTNQGQPVRFRKMKKSIVLNPEQHQ